MIIMYRIVQMLNNVCGANSSDMIPCMQVSQRGDIWNNGSDKPYVNAHGTMEGEEIL